MKETLTRGIEWISHNRFIERISDDEFVRGVVFGVIAGILLLFILRFIIWLLIRRRACSVLHTAGQSGEISISSHAASGVIRHAAEALECLNISKIRIYRRSGKYDIDIRARMDAAKGTAPQLMDKLTRIVKEQMQQVFGISNVNRVRLTIISCSGRAEKEDMQLTVGGPGEAEPAGKAEDIQFEAATGEKDETAETK